MSCPLSIQLVQITSCHHIDDSFSHKSVNNEVLDVRKTWIE